MAYSGPYPFPVAAGGTAKTSLPSFSAYVSAPILNVTGDGTAYTVIFGSEVFDTSSSYNTANGLFTAPVTGNYFLQFNLELLDIGAAHTQGQASFVVSTGADYLIVVNNPFTISNGSAAVITGSTIINLTAAQTVSVSINVFNSTKTIDIGGQAIAAGGLSMFNGFLLI